jgi:hypothetical protein
LAEQLLLLLKSCQVGRKLLLLATGYLSSRSRGGLILLDLGVGLRGLGLGGGSSLLLQSGLNSRV